jgi:hypothetical protein
MVNTPVKLQSECVKRLIEDALWTHLKKLIYYKKRHKFQKGPGFRK